MMSDNPATYTTPPDHIHFLAKRLFGEQGEIIDGAIAYISPGGGGPHTPHTHLHSHLFIVVDGTATILLDGKETIAVQNSSFTVPGHIPHSIWNRTDRPLSMIGISIRQ